MPVPPRPSEKEGAYVSLSLLCTTCQEIHKSSYFIASKNTSLKWRVLLEFDSWKYGKLLKWKTSSSSTTNFKINKVVKLASQGLWAKHRGTHCSSRGSHQATKWSCRGPPGKRHKALFGFNFEDRNFKRSFTSLMFRDWMINGARSFLKHIVTLLYLLSVPCFVFKSLFCPFTQVTN